MQVYGTGDLEKDHLSGATVAVLGYGNQGHAHARNLRDSGVRVTIGARRDREAWRRAERDNFPTETIDEAVRGADFVAMLLPDECHATVYTENVKPNLRAGAALVFAHGFSIAFGEIPVDGDHDILLVAPKGQGHYLRKSFTDGGGLSCLVAVGNEASGDAQQRLLSYAQGIGCLQAGAIETTFREEAITDLFGEQAVLCGGVPSLVKASFEVLVSKGYSPEVAYIECLHELKIITDLMVEGGIAFEPTDCRANPEQCARERTLQRRGPIVDESGSTVLIIEGQDLSGATYSPPPGNPSKQPQRLYFTRVDPE